METKLNWATDEKAIRKENFHNSELEILYLNIKDVFENCDDDFKLDINSYDGGKNAIGNRLKMAKQHFIEGNPMDLPEIGFNHHFRKIGFTNGRHRTLAAFQLGEEYIPFFVYKPDVEIIKNIVKYLENNDLKLKKNKKYKI